MTCKDCLHYEVCLAWNGYRQLDETLFCGHFKDKSKFIELPCIAMIEQFIKNGKFDKKFTSHNGRTAVVYMDTSKWGTPLIDVTSEHYNTREADERLSVLKEEAEQALKEIGNEKRTN